jgi:dimethylhistidine N-methyltransferase
MTFSTIYELKPTLLDFCAEVLKGLSGSPKTFLPQFLFHDEKGSDLFNDICQTQEYYVTRAEIGILKDNQAEIATLMGKDCLLIEYGSGSVEKVYTLLNAPASVLTYAPVDIARDHLVTYIEKTSLAYPNLKVIGIHADFTQRWDLPELLSTIENKVVLFLGGTIGNLNRQEAIQLLHNTTALLKGKGSILVGVDLKKDPVLLHAAYNDSQGITADFNLNILTNINRELEANFELNQFYHYAPYNPILGRIEMYLVSKCAQTVTVRGQDFFFREGEPIHTENSYKYSIAEFEELAHAAGCTLKRTWTDPHQFFSLHWLTL